MQKKRDFLTVLPHTSIIRGQRFLVHKKKEKGILSERILLCSAIEEVKVPKLEANPLSRLSDELVSTVQSLWVGSRVRWRKELLATVPEKIQCEETIRGIRNLLETFFLEFAKTFFVGFSRTFF